MDSFMDPLREIFGPSPKTLSDEDKTWLRHVLSRGLIRDPLEVEYLRSHLERMGTPLALSVPAWDREDQETAKLEHSYLSLEAAEILFSENYPHNPIVFVEDSDSPNIYVSQDYDDDGNWWIIGCAATVAARCSEELISVGGDLTKVGVSCEMANTYERLRRAFSIENWERSNEMLECLNCFVQDPALVRRVLLNNLDRGCYLPWGEVDEYTLTTSPSGGEVVILACRG